MTDIKFDYFTAAETEQYTFYRIPKALFTESHFQALSCEAKVLYGMMLDRLGLSIRNQWFDSRGRVYIIFTVEDVMGVMGCKSQKAVRLMKELDTVDGIGLIEKKRIGLGRPNRIYVKNFMVRENGGMGTRTRGACRIQAHAADISNSTGMSGKRASAPEKQLRFGGTIQEMKTDAEECEVGDTTAAMPEIQAEQDQNWWMCGEIMPENERHDKADEGRCREESRSYEENWWDMETDASSETKNPPQEILLCGNRNVGMGIAYAVDSVDSVDNVDKCQTAGNFMAEYQNSESAACFTSEKPVPEKGYGCRVDRTQTGYAAWNGVVKSYSVGGRPEICDRETVFADKEVETMLRELGQEWKTGPLCNSMECDREPKTAARQACQEPEIQACEMQDSIIVKTETPEQRDSKSNDTEHSKTEISKNEKYKTDFSAVCSSHQSYLSSETDPFRCHAQGRQQTGIPLDSEMDGIERKIDNYRVCIRENIDYQCFRPQDTESVDELVELMADTMMIPDRGTVRVAGMEKPASIVKSRFMKLVHSHIEYVMECMKKHTGKIHNIRAYLLTALFNSPLTISSYYRAEVNHDLYGLYGC